MRNAFRVSSFNNEAHRARIHPVMTELRGGSDRKPQRAFSPALMVVDLRRSITSRIDSLCRRFYRAMRESKFGLAVLVILLILASLAVIAGVKFLGGVHGLLRLAYYPKNVPFGPGVLGAGGAGAGGLPRLGARRRPGSRAKDWRKHRGAGGGGKPVTDPITGRQVPPQTTRDRDQGDQSWPEAPTGYDPSKPLVDPTLDPDVYPHPPAGKAVMPWYPGMVGEQW